jgi:hypothetical protein
MILIPGDDDSNDDVVNIDDDTIFKDILKFYTIQNTKIDTEFIIDGYELLEFE